MSLSIPFRQRQCQFLSALTPLQPRYAKKAVDADNLMAVIIAQAMNHGNHVMARTSDIPYHLLETTYQQYLRQATLYAANDCIATLSPRCRFFRITRSTSTRSTAASMAKNWASNGRP